MRIAQQLYEGIDTGSGNQGLITYMRTDSVSLAGEAINEIRKTIASEFGQQLAPEKPNYYQSKSKNAQEAHEAIRPTSASLTPIKLRNHLSDDQYRLYELIWNRAVASQMIPAVYDTVSAEFDVGETTFRASGSTLIEPGFLKVYRDPRAEQDTRLPEINEGDKIPLLQVRPEQHFTEPPPRYSEASLVKALEEYGIGRPSTYASIIQTLKDREYVELDNRRFIPTSTGLVVAKFLSQHFDRYVDYDFTARLEDELDAISRGEHDWMPLLEGFWQPFIDRVKEKDETVTRKEAQQAREAGHRAHRPLRPLRPDRQRRGRGKAAVRRPETGPEDGQDHARGSTRAVQAAPQPRRDARRRAGSGEYRALRPLRALRSAQFRLAQGARSA
jgi:DNA topoisomerase-1